MRGFRHFDREKFRKPAALAGILIIAAFAMIHAVHIHPEYGFADSAHCSLCAVAHASAAIIILTVCPVLVFISARWVCFDSPLRTSILLHPHHSRPPPAIA
jgi:hypothetical protein